MSLNTNQNQNTNTNANQNLNMTSKNVVGNSNSQLNRSDTNNASLPPIIKKEKSIMKVVNQSPEKNTSLSHV